MSRSENIHVSLRFRPPNQREIEEQDPSIWDVTSSSCTLMNEWADYLMNSKRISASIKSYNYNYCFTGKNSNQNVYETVAKRVVMASLQGYNGTIFAYGQTGSGKTYTMMGSNGAELDRLINEKKIKNTRKEVRRSLSPNCTKKAQKTESLLPIFKKACQNMSKSKGIIMLALEDLFAFIDSNRDAKTYYLSCSYLEIYNEQIYDLLSDFSTFKHDTLQVSEDPQKGFYVKNLSEHMVSSIQEVMELIERGESNRHYAATAMNHHSSRSHTIFRINVTSVVALDIITPTDSEDCINRSITTESVLNFVDLAGSERVGNLQEAVNPLETIVTGSRNTSALTPHMKSMIRRNNAKSPQSHEKLVNEGKHINASLFYLCQVITKLSEKSNSKNEVHIPYRNSNLTKILASSLGGNSLTCIICTATPTLSQFELTLSTLRFGGTARTITNTVAANIRSDKHAELLATYQRDIESLRRKLEEAESGGRTKAEEAYRHKKKLEERILKLTNMLFNRTKWDHERREANRERESVDLWVGTAGDLFVDTKLLSKYTHPKPKPPALSFDDKGMLAYLNMKQLSKEKNHYKNQLKLLQEQNSALKESRNNLTAELKKMISQSQKLLERKVPSTQTLYKDRNSELKLKLSTLQHKLNLIENKSVMKELDLESLAQLEHFFFKSLDTVKCIKIKKMYEIKMQESTSVEISDISLQNLASQRMKLREILGMQGAEDLETVSNSSQENEAPNITQCLISGYSSLNASSLSINLEENMKFKNILEEYCIEDIELESEPLIDIIIN